MKKAILVSGLVASVNPLSVQAALITHYDINFESPAHTAGSRPSVGSNEDQVSSIQMGNPKVQAAVLGMSGQSLQFNPVWGTHEWIKLDMGKGYDNYQISYSLLTQNLTSSDYTFRLSAETPSPKGITFDGKYNQIFAQTFEESGVQPYRSFTDGVRYDVQVDVDLVNSLWTVSLNGSLWTTESFTPASGDLTALEFGIQPWAWRADMDPGVKVFLDDIKVTSRTIEVSEPASLFLALGGMFAAFAAKRKKMA